MSQGFRFQGQVIFEKLTSIKSWLPKLVSLFYINIRFASSVNEGHFVDTRFCTHNLISEDVLNDHSYTQKIQSFITCINSFIAYHKNDLEILIVMTVCQIPKLDCQIKRYHMIKFSRSTCILFGGNQSRVINLN